MRNQQFSDLFYIAFIRLLAQGKQQIITIGAEHDLTVMQTLTLLMMAHAGELSMSDFSKMYACDASNVTGIVDGMEQKQLVSRQPHPADRRIKVIHVEPAGKALQEVLLKRLADISAPMFAKLDKQERDILSGLMIKLGLDLPEISN